MGTMWPESEEDKNSIMKKLRCISRRELIIMYQLVKVGRQCLELQMSCLLCQVCGCQTKHCGWGAVAMEAIKKDEFVIEYTGEGNGRIHKA